jgi:hypothetical protein
MRELLNYGAYIDFVQNNLVQAQVILPWLHDFLPFCIQSQVDFYNEKF